MSTAPGVCVCVRACVHCRSVCALGWVKYREHISLLIILCIIMYVIKIFFTKPITDYGKMLKYREKYRSTDISVDLYFSSAVNLGILTWGVNGAPFWSQPLAASR